MEVQELACKALIANVRFPLSPRMIDNRGQLIERFAEVLGTEQFGYSDLGVDVYTTNEHDHFRLTGTSLTASCEHPESVEETGERIKRFVREGVDALGVQHVQFLGVRTFWVAPTSSFGELRDALMERFSTAPARLADLAGKRPTDIGWHFEFHGSDPKVTVRMGPMTSEQAMANIFRVGDASLYPPEFLFMDLDRVLNDDAQPAAEVNDRLGRAIEHNMDLAGKFGRYFTTINE